jgi:hypothetical protein
MATKRKQKKGGEKTAGGLEQLFGSKTRFGLLKLFCKEPAREFFVRELAREIEGQLNAIRRELENLSRIGIVVEAETDDVKKKFYKLNTNFVLADQISTLVTRAELLTEKRLADGLRGMGNIDLCVLTGSLVGVGAPCDIFVVGRVKKEALAAIVGRAEKEFGKSISYTIFTPEEYKQRKSLADKFIFGILEAKKIVVTDKYGDCEVAIE